MFAVVKTGGKQYRVSKGDVIVIERLAGTAGDTVTLDHVLMMGDDKKVDVGTPLVKGGVVTAEIIEQARGDKIIVFKKKRRHNYRRKRGHRQDLTVLRITDIGTGAKKAAPKKTAESTEKTDSTASAKTEKKAAPKKAAGESTAKKAPAKKAAPKKTAPKKAE